MPFFPELLYQLSARDQHVTFADPINDGVIATAASALVVARFVSPVGRAMLLQSAMCRAYPNAGTTPSELQIAVLRPDETQPVNPRLMLENKVIRPPDTALNGEVFTISWQGAIVIPPLWQIAAVGAFSGALAANQTELSFNGMLVPAGNLQR